MIDVLRNYLPSHVSAETVLLAFAASFACSVTIAKSYELTYRGLSWSPALVQSLILGSLAACMIMMSVGDNVAGAIGIIGSLAIIRFRTNLRDPRDIVFVFCALGSGVACGLQAYAVGICGTLAFCAIAHVLHLAAFGDRRQHDGLIRFQLPAHSSGKALLPELLKQHTRTFSLVAVREVSQGAMLDYCYQVKLARSRGSDPDESPLLAAMGGLDGIEGLSYMNQQATVEV